MKIIEVKKVPFENILLKEDILSILESDAASCKILNKNISIKQGDLVGVSVHEK